VLASLNSSENSPFLLIGTYTEPEESNSEGVYVYRMDTASGKLSYQSVIRDVPNASYMTVHPQSGLIYAVSETEEFEGTPGGGVSVLSRDATGNFKVLYKQSSGGANPAYVSIDQTGRFALVANYKAGNVAMLPIGADGRLNLPSDVVQHVGSSAHPERQDGPHPHCIFPDPSNRFALAADLGADKLIIYRMDLQAGKLIPHAEITVEARTGPRHILFDSTGRRAYLMNELNSTMILYDYHAATGSLERRQTISTLPELFSERNLSGDFHFSLDKKYLYVSNRGHDSLVCFQVNPKTGELTYQSYISSNGHEPRIFAVDPSGRFIVAVHQKSRNAVVYKIDSKTGDLSHTGYEAELDMPVHVIFING
jgi:6-phosphogluconolactonase